MKTSYERASLRPAEWPVPWGQGQPEALVLSAGVDAFVIHPARQAGDWAVVRFGGCESVRHGGPNLEVAEAHPLGDRAEPGVLYLVQGSPWLRELEAINATHEQYSREHWRDVKHYLCFLWDSTFECLARSVAGKTVTADLRGALDHAARKIPGVR